MTQYRLNKNFKIRGSKNLPVDGLTTRTRNVREGGADDEVWNFFQVLGY